MVYGDGRHGRYSRGFRHRVVAHDGHALSHLVYRHPPGLADVLVWLAVPIAWLVSLALSYGWIKSGIWKRLAI